MKIGSIAAGFLAVTSCGKSGLVKVTGVVMMDGEPVHDAAVGFVPLDPNGTVGHGWTDENGRFVAYTTDPGDGIRPGKYKVTVQCSEKNPNAKTMSQIMQEKYATKGGDATTNDATKDAKQAYAQTLKEGAATKKLRVTPPVYADIVNTPLRADVPAQTEYTFELKKDAK